jgi:hypothetical protein
MVHSVAQVISLTSLLALSSMSDTIAASGLPVPLLALPGPVFPAFGFAPSLAFHELPFEVAKQRILLQPTLLDADEVHEVQTSTSVWDCAVVLLRLLEHHLNNLNAVPSLSWLSTASISTAIEVGAGQGLTGLGFSLLFPTAITVLSDVANVVPQLTANLELNDVKASAQPLDWLHAKRDASALIPQVFDVVLAADVVWMDHLVPPLVAALTAITVTGSHILLAHQTRSLRTEEHLFQLLSADFER